MLIWLPLVNVGTIQMTYFGCDLHSLAMWPTLRVVTDLESSKVVADLESSKA